MPKKKRMRVLYLQTFPLYGSGSGTYARYLAREMQAFADTLILCPDNRNLRTIHIKKLKTPLKVAFTGHPEWKRVKLFRDLENDEHFKIYKSFLEQTYDAVQEFKPDLIHVHHAFPFSWAARYIYGTHGIPYIVTIHGSELPTAEDDKRYYYLTLDALRQSKRLIPNSYYTRDWTVDVFGDEFKSKMTMIPGGVDTKKFKKTKTDDIDKEYNLKGKKVVLFTGKLTKYKGVEYLVRAAKHIHGEVLIAGDGSEMPKLKQIAKDQSIKNVHFLGHLGSKVSKLIGLYSRADVLVAPSIWDEPLGLVILEAMACETPVVVTKKGGIPLAVKSGRNGLFVRAKSVKDIEEKVNRLLDDDQLRGKMSKEARHYAVNKFSWSSIAERFFDVYERFV